MPKSRCYESGNDIHHQSLKAKNRKRYSIYRGGNPGIISFPAALRTRNYDTIQRKGFKKFVYSDYEVKNIKEELAILQHHLKFPKFNPQEFNSAMLTIRKAYEQLGSSTKLDNDIISTVTIDDKEVLAIIHYTPWGCPENGFFQLKHIFDTKVAYKKAFNMTYLKAINHFGFYNFGWAFQDMVTDFESLEWVLEDMGESCSKRNMLKYNKCIVQDINTVKDLEKEADTYDYDELLAYPALTQEGLIGRIMWLALHTDYKERLNNYQHVYYGIEDHDNCYYDFFCGSAYSYDEKAMAVYESHINASYQNYGGLAPFYEFRLYTADGRIVTNQGEPWIWVADAITAYDFKMGIIYDSNKEENRCQTISEYIKAYTYLVDLYEQRGGSNTTLRRDCGSYQEWLAGSTKAPFPKATAKLHTLNTKVRKQRPEGVRKLRSVLHGPEPHKTGADVAHASV